MKLTAAFALLLAAAIPTDESTNRTNAMTVNRSQPFALAQPNGGVEIWRDQPVADCHLIVFGPEWQGATLGSDAASTFDARSRTAQGVLEVRGTDGAQAMCSIRAESSDSSLRLRYRIEFPRAVELKACRVAFGLPVSRHKNRDIVILGADAPAKLVVPSEYSGAPGMWSGEARGVEIAPGTDDHLVVTSARPIYVNVQDNREWGGDEIEVGFHLPLPAGYVTESELTVSMPGLQFVPDLSLAPSSNQTDKWFVFPLAPDAAPVDLSWLNHKPAGAHGFVTAQDGRLTFEDGTPARFWGTCFSAGACFPTHERAEIIARRLAQFGVNIARLHHMDSDWGDVRLLDLSTGDTRHFDRESLDRLDYFIYCLKREGVYVYLDNLVSRQFTEKDGVDAAEKLEFKASPYSLSDPKLIELQKEFCTNLWTHVNPYTGLRYCDDPAIALTEIVNEADLFTGAITLEPYRARLAARFRGWATERGLEPPEQVDFAKKSGPVSQFFADVMRAYFGEMRAHLRAIGVRVPIAGTNWSINSAVLAAMEDMDLFDSHGYQCHPSREGAFENVPLVSGDPGAFCALLAFNRVAGKPFVCSEWNEPWPNEWRAEMPLHLAYIAALQGWDGMAIYTYHHSATPPPAHISGWFETFNDPALFGLFPHAALLLRRGDAAGAKARVGVELGERDKMTSSPVGAASAARGALSNIETHRMEVLLPGDGGAAFDNVLRYDSGASRSSPVRSDTGEYARQFEPDRNTGHAVIDTPRTQAAYGFWGDLGPVDTSAVRFDITTDFAAVAVSSLTDDPIGQSDDLLVTAVGRAENTGQLFDLTHRSLVSRGGEPIVVEPIRGTVRIRTGKRDLRAYALAPSGRVLHEAKLAPTADGLELQLTAPDKTIYWRITSRALGE